MMSSYTATMKLEHRPRHASLWPVFQLVDELLQVAVAYRLSPEEQYEAGDHGRFTRSPCESSQSMGETFQDQME